VLCFALALPLCAAQPDESPAAQMDQIRATLARGDSSRAYQMIEEGDWDVTTLSAEELATLAELDLQVWRYGLATRIARLALERHSPPPAPAAMGPDPFVQRMNRVLGISLYLTARGGGPTPELAKLDQETALDTSASLFRELTSAPGGDPRDELWLARVLTQQGHKAQARAALDHYLAAVGSDHPDEAAERLQRCFHSPDLKTLEENGTPTGATQPRKLESPQPPYTDAARHAGLEGEVVVWAIIDHEGRPICLRSIKGLPLGLTEMAVRTMSTWRLEPATLDGEPVPVTYLITFDFKRGAGD
jgi:TonB family protein